MMLRTATTRCAKEMRQLSQRSWSLTWRALSADG